MRRSSKVSLGEAFSSDFKRLARIIRAQHNRSVGDVERVAQEEKDLRDKEEQKSAKRRSGSDWLYEQQSVIRGAQ